MIKKIIKRLMRDVVMLFSFLFPPYLFKKLTIVFNRLYSLYLSQEFNKSGKFLHVCYPLYLNGGKYISVGDNFFSDKRLRLDTFDFFLGDKFTPEIVIGDNVSIQKDCHIGSINKIVIGNNVLLASKVYISDHFHGEISREALSIPPAKRRLFSKGPVIIEDSVWLGEGVVVLPNVTIGENSIVGANSVVTKSFPKNSVIAGNPAKLIKMLD